MKADKTLDSQVNLLTKEQARLWAKSQTVQKFKIDHLYEFLKTKTRPGQIWTAFQSFQTEPLVNWDLLAKDFQIHFAFPKISERGQQIDFYLAENFALHPLYKIWEPKASSWQEKLASKDLSGMLIPGLAFDNRGYRLGRGKGFYDRYLKDFQGLKVGLCSQSVFLLQPLPKDHWDVKMDYIVTEDFVFNAE